MKSALVETLEYRLPPDLAAVRAVARELENHLRLRGLDRASWEALELGIVEGINNAIVHGCRDRADGGILVRVTWRETRLILEIRDPGAFTPGASWGELPDDPLSEGGRGGYLIGRAFPVVEHRNGGDGHTLHLECVLARRPAGVDGALEAFEAVRAATAELETTYETVAGLRHLVTLLAKSTAPGEIVERALARLREIEAFELAHVRKVTRADLEFVRGLGAASPPVPRISLGDEGVEARAVLTLGTQHVESCDALAPGDPLHGLGGAALVVPICFEDERIGVVVVVRGRGAGYFGAGFVELVHTLAEFLGVAWATEGLQARQRELEVGQRELRLAAEMQARLLPEVFPERRDVRFSGICRSAQAVGGDFYDVFQSGAGTIVVIADAMGKGMPAAFVASVLRCAIRAREGAAADPGMLLMEVNRQICPDLLAVDIFITALVGFIPEGGALLRLASAGHCPVLVRRGDGAVESVSRGGVPLGVLEGARYTSTEVPLAPRDAVVFFTDGLYEIGPAPDPALGLDLLRSVVGATAGCTADEMVDAIMLAAEKQSSGHPAGDDRTLLICERVA